MTRPTADQGPQASFARAYQDIVDRWPVPVTALDAPTDYGATHLLTCGAQAAPVLMLLPGWGATATAWSAAAAELSRSHRVVAVDPVGQAGLSTPGDRPVRTEADLTGWLDQLLAWLGVGQVALMGHSYGAWVALRYALHAHGRVSGLVLLEPTDCFATLSLRYRLRAIPLLARPSAERARQLLAWETRGRKLDPGWLAVIASGADLGRFAIVPPRPPRPSQLAGLDVPTLVVTAARSRAHDPGKVARRARERLPGVTTVTLPQATHYTIATQDAHDVADSVEGFLFPGRPEGKPG